MSEIRELAQHRWMDLLTGFGVPETLMNKRNQPCIFCGGKDRARLTDHLGYGNYLCSQCCPESIDGFDLLMRFTGKDFKEIAGEVRAMLGSTEARPAQNSDVSKNRKKLRAIWAESKPLSKGCPTHRYLINRGLAGLDFASLIGIRCHPALTYWHVEGGEFMNLGKHPAMIGLVTTPDGLPATIHCTYLQADGSKAALDPVRKIMTPSRSYKGGAVRLQTLGKEDPLCVAEGIETALAMKLLYPDMIPWACISAGNMESFEPPLECNGSTMYIAADSDVSFTGQAAAYALAKKLTAKKHKALVLVPEQIGTDFLDEYNSKKQVSA